MAEAAVADPFERLSAGYAGSVRDPYPAWAELRAQSPVHAGTPNRLLGIPELVPPLPDAPPIFTILGHAAVSEVLRDGERFSSGAYANTMGIVMGRTILQMDEPEHRRYRGLLQKGFTQKALERWGEELIGPVVRGCIAQFAPRGRAELVRELTFPFPVNVIAGMLGLPEPDLPRFHRWAIELISIGFDFQRAVKASQDLHAYLAGVVAERRREPRDDFISVLAQAELDGQRLDDDEIIAFLRLLLPAGAETTYRSSSNLFFGLLSHPEQLAAVREDRSLVPQAIEEGLRWESPLTSIIRRCTRDTRVAGVEIPEGALLSVCVAAANRDPERYENPHAFDVFRPPKQVMSFGFGAHRCLGMHLARIETQIALEALLELPGLRLDPGAEDVHIAGLIFRSPRALPVVFDPVCVETDSRVGLRAARPRAPSARGSRAKVGG